MSFKTITNRPVPTPILEFLVQVDPIVITYDTVVDIWEEAGLSNKISAIKRVRERFGIGLKDAKEIVEAVQAHERELGRF